MLCYPSLFGSAYVSDNCWDYYISAWEESQMKVWGYCDQSIATDVGPNFLACFYDYYLFPGMVAIFLLLLGIIIYERLSK